MSHSITNLCHKVLVIIIIIIIIIIKIIIIIVSSEINSLSRYVESCNSPLLEAVYKEEVLRCYAKSCEAMPLQQERKEHSQEKQLCGQFWRNTAEVGDKNLKDLGVNEKEQTKEGQTEGMIMTAQDQALRTNSLKRIMCGEIDETFSHILSECNKLAQTRCQLLEA